MADDGDTVWLPILPSFRDFAGALTRGTAGAGERAGRAVGEGIAGGIASSRAAVEKASALVAKAQDRVADATGKQTVAQAKLVEMQERGITRGGRYAAALEAVSRANRGAEAAARAARTATDQLTAAETAAESATDDLGVSVERTGGGLKNMFGGLGGGIKQLAGLAAGAAGVSGAMAGVGKAMANEADFSKLAAAQGASPELAKEYGVRAGKLYASGLGDSMADVTSAIDSAQSSFATLGYEGEASLEQVTTRAVNFGKTFDTDVDSAIQTAAQLVQNGLAVDSTQAFDLMTTSFQRVPKAMREELPEILQEYGTNFRALGIEGPDAFNMLVSAAGNGKFALDKTGDALKEFTIRGSDMSKTSAEAYGAIGLDAQTMSNAIATGGSVAKDALTQTANGLLAIEDPSARANAAIALFGTPLEDLSIDQIPAFLSGLTGAENAMAGFEGSADAMGTTLNDNASSKLETFKRGIESTFVNMLGDNVLPLVGDFTGALDENEGSLLGAVAGMTGLGGAVAGFETAKGVFDSVGEGITSVKDGFMSVKDTATQAWDTASNAGSWVKNQARATGSFIKTSASAVANAASTSAAWITAQGRAAAGWIAMQARAVAAFVATAASAVAQALVTSGAWVAAQARTAAGWAVTAATATASFVVMSASAIAQAAATAGAWVASNARVAASFLISRGAMVATTVATGAMTAAQWLLNAAMSANPIGLIIIAVTALVAGLVWFFTQTEIGRKIVTAAWDAIKAGWDALWAGVSTGIDLFVAGLGAIGDAAVAVKDWVVGKFDELVGFVTGLPSRITSAVSGMWNGITESFKAAINWIIRKWNDFQLVIGGGTVLGVDIPKITLDTPNIPMFRDGGKLSGPGGPRSDSMLIRASNGEFMTRASSVTPETLPILEAINDGWVPSADFLHSMVGGFDSLLTKGDYTGNLLGQGEDSALVDAILQGRKLLGFADGGLISTDALRDFARGVDGKPYEWGGVNWGDCSGAVSALANFATGRDPFGSRFATGNEADELAARGFVQGKGTAGDLLVGFKNGGPGGGHTAATLPTGENFEMGGAYGGGKFGGTVGGNDSQFTDFWHLPASAFTGGNPAPDELPASVAGAADPALDSAASASAGSASSASSIPSTSTSAGSGASSMSLSDYAGQTASDFASGTVKDTLDFFGFGKLADLPIIPVAQPSPDLAAQPTAVGGSDGSEPLPAGGGGGPLIQLGDVTTFNLEDLMNMLRTEANRLVRSDAVSTSGWGG